jgi:hypothetical protein
MRNYDEETDGFCPKCDNKYLVNCVQPKGGFAVSFQGSSDMVRDDREKQKTHAK